MVIVARTRMDVGSGAAATASWSNSPGVRSGSTGAEDVDAEEVGAGPAAGAWSLEHPTARASRVATVAAHHGPDRQPRRPVIPILPSGRSSPARAAGKLGLRRVPAVSP
jgi:hypothetical protein